LKETADILARMRVASPCPAKWDEMEGDARVRFCRLCSLNVYDISEMTRAEVEALVLKTEGRLCGRLTRRADGKVLTKDCPVGLRALRLRATRAAGAAFAALLSLCPVAFGQTRPQKNACPAGGAELKVERRAQAGTYSTVSGVVADPACAVVPKAHVSLKSRETGRKFEADTSDEGEFLFAAVQQGTYELEISAPGFRSFKREDFYVGGSEEARLGVMLDVGVLTGEIVVVEEPDGRAPIESRPGSTVIRNKALTDLPVPPEKE
jgi:Carboxypeptidase regulatory-like domain